MLLSAHAAFALPDLFVARVNPAGVHTDTQSLRVTGTVAVAVRNRGDVIPGGYEILAFEDTNRSGRFEPQVDTVLGRLPVGAEPAPGAESVIHVPVNGVVSFRGNLIYALIDSQGTVPEVDETNNLGSTASAAKGSPLPTSFSTKRQWAWNGASVEPSYKEVIQAPVVANLTDDNGDGRINTADVPDVVFVAGADLSGGACSFPGVLRVIRGDDGSPVFSVPLAVRSFAPCNTPAVADLNGDGVAEIVAAEFGGARFAVLSASGTVLYSSDIARNPSVLAAPVVADVDHDGAPEVIYAGTLFDNLGKRRVDFADTGNADLGSLATAADLDLDGDAEIVTGHRAYRHDGSVFFDAAAAGGYPGIANFDADRFAEIVIVEGGRVWLREHDGTLKWGPVAIPGGGRGGPPTIADFDADGQVEIGVAGQVTYTVFETDGQVKWSKVTRDTSSHITGSSVFDFDGDGSAEVLYNDEQYLRVFRGRDGQVLTEIANPSCTAIEYPVVVDVDNDSHAEILVSRNQICGFGNSVGVLESGLVAFEATLNDWTATRRIWNQHDYHITNVTETGDIPRFEQPNWLSGLNNFRLNSFDVGEGTALPIADLTSSRVLASPSSSSGVRLTARIGNGGSAVAEGSTLGPNLITNGSFELASVPCPRNTLSGLFGGDTSITGWSVTGQSIRYVHEGFWEQVDGRCNVDLDGGTGHNGGVEQIVQTIPGRTYEVSFWMAGNFVAAPALKTGVVSAGGSSSPFSFDTTGRTLQNMGFQRFRWRFVADATATPLRIVSTTNPAGWGPVIDDVQVRQVLDDNGAVLPRISFYNGDPGTGGTLLGTVRTSKGLAPGEYEDVSFDWIAPPAGLRFIVVVADDDGTGLGTVMEADETNNKAGTYLLIGVTPVRLIDDLISRFKDRSVDLRWTPIPGAVGYNIYRRLGTGPLVAIRRGLASSSASFTDIGLTNGTTYRYVVRWVDAAGVESSDGTEASATPTSLTARGLMPPTILSAPVTRAITGGAYQYLVRASDPDLGDLLTHSVVSGPQGMVITGAGLITWVPLEAQVGYQTVTVRATDRTGRFVEQTYRLFVELTTASRPPAITSSPISSGRTGVSYTYLVMASDLDVGDSVTFSLGAAPEGLTINPATGAVAWIPRATQAGANEVTVVARDLVGLTASQTFTVHVVLNRAPVFSTSPVTGALTQEAYSYDANATDPDNDAVTFSLQGAPAGMAVDATTGVVSWLPTLSQAGPQNATLRAADAYGGASTQAFVVNVKSTSRPPTISTIPSLEGEVDLPYAYDVSALDPDVGDLLLYTLSAAPAGMTIHAVTGAVRWTPTAAQHGANLVTIVVTDITGLTATQSFTVTVVPADLVAPSITIETPSSGAVLTDDVMVVASVEDVNLREWALDYRVKDTSTWTRLAAGTSAVTSGVLGTFPVTLVANNPYILRVTAVDSRRSVSREIEVLAHSKSLKLGDFTLAYEDLRVSGLAFPVQVTRNYDSKRSQPGDFGPGWTLGFTAVDLRRASNNDVFMTLPTGRRVRFQHSPVSSGGPLPVYTNRYLADVGIPDTLENLDCPLLLGSPGGFLCQGLQVYDPQHYRLRTKEGFTLTITASGGITRIENRSGQSVEIGATGLVTSFGRSVVFERDGAGRIIRMRDAAGKTLEYEYDALGRLRAFVDRNGNRVQYTYLGNGYRLESVVAPTLCSPLRMEYNSDGRLAARVDEAGLRTAFVYDTAARTETVTDARGHNWVRTFDEDGRVVTVSDGAGRETRFEYDAGGNNTAVTLPSGRQVSRTFDARGNVSSQLDGGAMTSFFYNAFDQIAQVTRPGGDVTVFTYDARGNLTGRERRAGTGSLSWAERFAYDDDGRQISWTDAGNGTTTYTYNNFGDLESRRDPTGVVVHLTYDANGNALSVTDAAGATQSVAYDGNEQPQLVQHDGVTIRETSYNELGMPMRFTDALGGPTEVRYSCGGVATGVSDPAGTPLSYERDEVGNLIALVDGLGRRTAFALDATNRPVARTTPGGRTIEQSYNPDGLLASTTAPNGTVVTYAYDNLSRLTRQTSPGRTANYVYDASHRLVRVDEVDGVQQFRSTYEYDGLGRVIQVTSGGRTLQYAYNARGDRASMTTPDGTVTFYEYDAAGRVTLFRTGSAFVRFSYDAAGRRQEAIGSNGTRTVYGYDRFGHIERIVVTNALGTQLAAFTYTRDVKGRIVMTTRPDGTITYTYDNLDRLTSETSSAAALGSYTRSYAYDATGNRLDANAVHGVDQELTRDSHGPYVVDDNGNVGARLGRTYTYDWAGRLIGMAGPGETASYQYDFLGNRIRKSVNSEVREYLYDGLQPVGEYLNGATAGRYTFGFGLDEPLMVSRGGRTYWYHADAQGSIVAITDDTGLAVQTYAYDAWGNIGANNGDFAFAGPGLVNLITYTGREFDQELGLYYYRARAYDARLGRFWQRDPEAGLLANPQTQHPYAYALNDPANAIDPTGKTALVEYNLSMKLHDVPAAMIGFLTGFGASNLEFLGQYLAAGDHAFDIASRWEAAVNAAETNLKNRLNFGFSEAGGKPGFDQNGQCRVDGAVGGGVDGWLVLDWTKMTGLDDAFWEGAKFALEFSVPGLLSLSGLPLNSTIDVRGAAVVKADVVVFPGGFNCGAQLAFDRLRRMQPQ